MNEETAQVTLDSTNKVLENLRGLEPTLAAILVVSVLAVVLVYLLIRFGKQQSEPNATALKIASDAVTEISAVQRIKDELYAQVGGLRVQVNELTNGQRELKEQADKAEERAKILQASLDEANKKLEDMNNLLKAKEAREKELVAENAALREDVAALRRQIADLQFQLNQAIRKQIVDVAEDTPHEPEALTPSPDL